MKDQQASMDAFFADLGQKAPAQAPVT